MNIGHLLDTASPRPVELSTHVGTLALPRRGQLRPSPEVMLFDLDGTLVDTMAEFADLAAEVIVRHYGLLRRNARHLYLQTSGVPFAQQLDLIFGEHDENGSAAEEFEARKVGIASTAAMDDTTTAAVEALRNSGVRLVVSSNGQHEHVTRFAARSRGLFDLALGYAPGRGLEKGEPHVSTVCDTLGVARERMVFVGDSLRDGELADATGLGFIARAGTFARRDLERRFPSAPVVDAIAEIPGLL